MATVTKRQLAEKVAQKTGQTQVITKQVVQLFPRTGERVTVPPKRVVTFKMGKSMRGQMNTVSAEVKAMP